MTISVNAVVVNSPPWVDLYISVLPAGTVKVEVTRTWMGVSERVRGDSTTMVFGTDVRIVDWAAPVGTGAIGYSIAALSSTGSLLETKTVSTTATTIGHNVAWLSDPHDPTGAVLVTVLRPEGPENWNAPGAEAVATMTGLPLALDTRRSWRERSISFRTDTEESTALAAQALDSSVLLLRGAPGCLDHPTGVMYIMSPGVSRYRPTAHVPPVDWTIAGPETRGPQAPPAVSSRTYQDDLDEQATYQDSLTAYPTYIARVRG